MLLPFRFEKFSTHKSAVVNIFKNTLKWAPRVHLPKVGHIDGGIFPHTDMLESFGFFFSERPLLGEHYIVKNF